MCGVIVYFKVNLSIKIVSFANSLVYRKEKTNFVFIKKKKWKPQ